MILFIIPRLRHGAACVIDQCWLQQSAYYMGDQFFVFVFLCMCICFFCCCCSGGLKCQVHIPFNVNLSSLTEAGKISLPDEEAKCKRQNISGIESSFQASRDCTVTGYNTGLNFILWGMLSLKSKTNFLKVEHGKSSLHF